MVQPKKPSIKEFDFEHYVIHYLHLLWRWKWWIVLIAPPLSGLFFLIFLKVTHPFKPELTAKVLIGLENTESMSAFAVSADMQPVGEGKTDIITTRNFLKDIVNQLSLRLYIENQSRDQIFDTVYVGPEVMSGEFRLEVNPANNEDFTLTYTNKKLGHNNTILTKGSIKGLSSITLPGMYLQFNPEFLNNPQTIVFGVESLERTIEALLKKIVIVSPNIRLQEYNISLSVKGTDYNLIAKIANAMADHFIERNLSFKKRKIVSTLEVLQKQFEKAQAEVSVAENNLRAFRTVNPTVGLSEAARQTLSNLTDLENSVGSLRLSLNEGRKLSARYSETAREDQVQMASEIASFLQSKGNTSASVLGIELTRLLAERKDYLQQYGKTHPRIQENQGEIDKVKTKIVAELVEFIKKAENSVTDKTAGAQNLSIDLQRLPSKELELAELQRKMQIASDIYSTVLNKYNQAKVGETMALSDAYIMDYAIPPLLPLVNWKKLIGVAIGILLALALGPMIVSDFLNKSARTETELRGLTDLVILESIPKIQAGIRKKK